MASSSSPFLRAITDVLAGARHARELAEVLVTEAVQATLARVTADFPLDFGSLVARYQDEVVRRCCALFQTEDTCRATTKTGKPCARRAVVDGACAQHLESWRAAHETHRRREAYAASVRAPADPHLADLRAAGRKRTVSMAFPDAEDAAALL